MQNLAALFLLSPLALNACSASGNAGAEQPLAPKDRDIRSIPVDLAVPPVTAGTPAAGKRVKLTPEEYEGTDVYHVLYLPEDWRPGKTYPVLVEYAGNGPYSNKYGDLCSGRPEGCSLGYGISGGRGYLWLCLPYISKDGTHNQRRWWGSRQRTIDYCKTVLPRICTRFGGDPNAVVLAGFSRGAIACNVIGLGDDEIAKLWCGFVCHSHYDGARSFRYEGVDPREVRARMARLGDRPQWISHETSIDVTQKFLHRTHPGGRFTFRALPFRNHTDLWVLRDLPLRRELRAFVARATRPDARKPR